MYIDGVLIIRESIARQIALSRHLAAMDNCLCGAVRSGETRGLSLFHWVINVSSVTQGTGKWKTIHQKMASHTGMRER
ncbi:hypothetical protein TUM17560_00780 [Serratia marcescens]|jgi:hypothetical protein|nr:hypothetical protein TUM17560_00780 [Serratia marcescens]